MIDSFWPYVLVLTGIFAEGETALLTSMAFSSAGQLNRELVFLCAFVATAVSDWTWFFAGRFSGNKLLNKHQKWKKNSRKARVLINRYPLLILFGYRFVYGLRTVIPLMIGMSRTPVWKFLAFSGFSIFVWTLSFGLLFNYLAEQIVNNLEILQSIQMAIPIAIILLLVLLILFIRFRQIRLSGQSNS